MNSSFRNRLENKLSSLRKLDLERTLPLVSSPQHHRIEVNGNNYLNFSSNDYLGLATSQDVIQAAQGVLERYGLGSGGSRLICGEHPLFKRLETLLADWKRTEAALSFGSGYLTSLGIIPAVLTGRDAVFYDELAHRCLLEGIKVSNAEGFEFKHNNPDSLERLLKTKRSDFDAVMIVTEGIFSMDGDRAPLEELVDLSEYHDAWLLVDEAHSSGVWGPGGAGLTVEHRGSVELAMGTLSKAVGGYGGYVAGSKFLRKYLINRATPFIYSTGLPASTVAGNLTALRKISSQRTLRENLKGIVEAVSRGFEDRGIPLPDPPSQIIPLVTGTTADTLEAGRQLKENGLYAVPIRPPTVPRGLGRIRFSLRSDHSEEHVARLLDAVERLDQADLIKREDIWSP